PRIVRRRNRNYRARRRSSPAAENPLDLRGHGVSGKIADDDEQRIGRRIIVVIELLKLRMLDRCHLFFGGRDDGIGMLAEKDAAESLAREKTGRGAFDAQAFDFAAALALEFFSWKRGIAREITQQIEKAFGKFGEAGN